MVDWAEITDLIGAIYDAGSDGREWSEILQRALAVIGGSCAILYWNPLHPARATLLGSVGAQPDLCAVYAAHYMDLKDVLGFEQQLPAGAVFAASDALPRDALRAAFCNDSIWPQGCVDFLGTVLERSSDGVVRLLVHRSEQQGRVDDGARQALALLAPHLQRALRLGRLLARSQRRVQALTEALEQMTTAVILVDRDGRLVHANRPGLQRLADADIVCWSSAGLRLRSAAIDRRLRALLAARPSEHAKPEEDPTSDVVMRGDGERVQLRLLALSPSERRRELAPDAAAALILVAHHAPDLIQRVQSAARHYAFTPAEARVVQALMGGRTIGSAARQLGITVATVKTHLQHVFDKTNTRRQVDLVKRIADHVPVPLQRSLRAPYQLGLGV